MIPGLKGLIDPIMMSAACLLTHSPYLFKRALFFSMSYYCFSLALIAVALYLPQTDPIYYVRFENTKCSSCGGLMDR